MKNEFRNVCFFVIAFCFTVNTSHGQITRVEINTEALYQPIDSFVHSLSMKPTDLGVIKMYFKSTNFDPYRIDEITNGISNSQLEGEIVLELELNKYGLILRPPSHYFVYNDRPILIYSGAEQIIKFKKSEVKKFMKKISYRLQPLGTVSFPLPSMKFTVKDGKIEIVPPK